MGAIRQLATDYWQLLFKDLFRAAHWVRAAKTDTHPSSRFLNTASSHPLARAQVTSACDANRGEKLPPQALKTERTAGQGRKSGQDIRT